jgi:hypothetical protein
MPNVTHLRLKRRLEKLARAYYAGQNQIAI